MEVVGKYIPVSVVNILLEVLKCAVFGFKLFYRDILRLFD